ncbi:aminopeptidase N [Microlunatus flavus]|uniref:Aminopeptidase N n=1 Tax=Microlunatus flavus TaxID=1036181 RepID=A0A1H9CUM2_9ACTN|nr:aminopeptidase N [Microlunatus flavus]SEQ04885.1 aminopeptidase N [Microlunatus flavus]
MFPDNLTRAEAQARAALIGTDTYAVHVDLSGREVEDPERLFTSTSTIRFTARDAGSLHVDLIAERVRSASLDGTALDPATFVDSRLPFDVTPGEHELVVDAVVRYSRSGDGLHRFVDPSDGAVCLYTQFEPADARRVYACFEQPDLKARFAVSVVAPSSWTVVSGGAVETQEADGDGFTLTRFAETKPVSTYLTSLLAGDYAVVEGGITSTAGPVAANIVVRRSLVDSLDPEAIFAVTQGGFEVFEQSFGVAYPFGKYDQAFVPEYNAGAMENIGLVTFRDEYVFRSRVTQASRDYRREVILHELAHMWFGDLVTMRWWDDLWLKESFATWCSNFAAEAVTQDPATTWATFSAGSKTGALRADQLPSTHPIAADIVDLEAVSTNFDQITYGKGASVLAQLVAFVGRDAFLAGARNYFAEHAYGNTSLVDLLRALEPPSGRDLTAWSRAWLETAGVNTIALEVETGEDGTLSAVDVVQTASAEHDTLRPHRLGVGAYDLVDGRLALVHRSELDVDGSRTPVPELVGRPRPALLLPNDGDLTFAKVRLDERSRAAAVEHLPLVGDPLARAVLWASLWDSCRDAELPARDYVDVVLRAAAVETVPTQLRLLLGQASLAASSYTGLGERAEVQARLETGLFELLGAAAEGSDEQLALARSFAAAANPGWGGDALAGWLEDRDVPVGLVVDRDLRWLFVGQLARLGRIDGAGIDAEQARDDSNTGIELAAGARAARPTPEAKAEAWRLACESDEVTNSVQSAICVSFWQRGQDEVLRGYVEPYLAMVEEADRLGGVWRHKGAVLRTTAVRNLFPVPEDREPFLARLDAWLGGVELSASVSRTIRERRDDALRSLRCQRAAQRP